MATPRWSIRALIVVLLLGSAPADVAAEWQIKPFLGFAFGGETNLAADLEDAAGKRHLTYGVSALWLGEILGLEAEFMHAPGFFETEELNVIEQSSMTTAIGNVIVALPRRMTQYTLRPYFAAGVGLVRLVSGDEFSVYPLSDNQLASSFGVGVTGFFNDRVGVGWDLRRLRRMGSEGEEIDVITPDPGVRFSFWRANMSFVVRF